MGKKASNVRLLLLLLDIIIFYSLVHLAPAKPLSPMLPQNFYHRLVSMNY